jgi:hypothetical protein
MLRLVQMPNSVTEFGPVSDTETVSRPLEMADPKSASDFGPEFVSNSASNPGEFDG